MNVNDILKFTVTQTFLNQTCLNIMFYQIISLSDPEPTLFGVANQYYATWEDNILPRQSELVTLDSVKVDNMTDGISFAEDNGNATGNILDAALPRFVSYAVRLNRSTKVTRNGAKRICGVGENQQTDGIVDDPAPLQAAVDLMFGNDLGLAIDGMVGDDIVMRPIIVGRTLSPSGVYELDLTKINVVSSAVVSNQLTTQNTRKQ